MSDPHDRALPDAAPVAAHVAAQDWPQHLRALDRDGHAALPALLAADECAALAAAYARPALYRSKVIMARHGFGRGEYQYFARPLPDFVAALRETLYPRLLPLANRWNQALRIDVRYPDEHAAFVRRCHEAGQTRPTPLLLEYGPGDYNCLHQDLYGEHVFPLQVAILLSEPGRDFDGGEFMLTEQRAGHASRADVVPLRQGDAVAFAVHQRRVRGQRGTARAAMRHGVSTLLRGRRHVLGIVFHDAH